MKVVVEFEMDERTANLFLQSSIERVINTSIDMIEKINDPSGVNLEDWDEWKPLVCGMWIALHDSVFKEMMLREGKTTTPRVAYTLRAGRL